MMIRKALLATGSLAAALTLSACTEEQSAPGTGPEGTLDRLEEDTAGDPEEED
jgi:hypothetical protein